MDVYPNPANDQLHIDLKGEKAADYAVEMTSVQGQVLYQRTFDKTTDVQTSINTGSFASGVYFVKITSGDKVTTKRVVIQH